MYRLGIKHVAALLLAGPQEHQGLIPYTGNIFFLPQSVDYTGAHPSFYPMDTTVLSQGLGQPAREADYLFPSGAEIKKTWSPVSTSPYVFLSWYFISRDKLP
jgi:hypothetical protein